MRFHKKLLLAFAIAVGLVVFAVLAGIALGLVGTLMMLLPLPAWVDGWMVLIAAALLWMLMPDHWKSWNKPYEIRGQVTIEASLNTVWDLLLPQAGRPYHAEIFKRIDAVQGEPERLDFVADPKAVGAGLPPLQVLLDKVDERSYLRMRYLNLKDYPSWSKDLLQTEYFLEPSDAGVKVTMVETLERLRLSSIVSLFILNPCRDGLLRVKALCEGQPDQSWMTWMTHQNAQAGSTSFGIGGVGTIALLACVFLTILVWGLVHGLTALAQ